MTLREAIDSGKRFKRENQDEYTEYFKPKTGPFSYLVDCDYFVIDEEFNTSIDLYYEDLIATDYTLEEK